MKPKHKRYLEKNCKDLRGKVVVVTGATGTIGKEIVINCLFLGADVIMAVRNTEKGNRLKTELSKIFNPERIKVMQLDISDIKSIDNFAKNAENIKINYLINNAGIFNSPAKNEEFEIHYITNYLGQIYLSLKLSEILNSHKGSKIIFQSSISYRFCRIDWNDTQNRKIKGKLKIYSKTKRLLTQTIIALKNAKFEEYKNISFCFAHPGVCSSDIISHKHGGFSKSFSVAGKIFLNICCHSAKTASLSATLAISKYIPHNKILAPRFFGIWGRPKLRRISKKLFNLNEIEKAKNNFNADLALIERIKQL